MSNKIESVELEAFRAYKNKIKFDFTSDSGVNNLVLIHAPNGTGKTTIFDAIEWAMTGKIARISDNSQVKGIAEKEKGNILKNIESDVTNGIVKLNFTEGNYIESKTRTINKRQKTDYSPGKAVSTPIFDDSKKNTQFVEKNILKNHQIDKFLRFQNSRERYDALSVFWDSKNESELYYSLIIVSDEVNKYYNDLILEGNKLTDEIKNLSLGEEVVKEIKQRIYIINNFEKEEKLAWLDDEYNSLYEAASKYKVSIEMKYLDKSKYLEELVKFAEEYKVIYNKSLNELEKNTNVELPKLIQLKEKFIRIGGLQEKKREISNELKELNQNVLVISYLKENEQIISELENNLKEYYINFLEVQNERLTVENENGINLSTKVNLNNHLKEYENRLKENDRKIFLIRELKKQLKNGLNIESLTHEENKLIDQNKVDQFELTKKNLSRQNLKAIVERDSKEFFRDLDLLVLSDKELEGKFTIYKSAKQNLELLENRTTYLKDQISKIINLGTEIDKLKELSLKLISKTNRNTCPVCNNRFKDYQSLLDKVQSELERDNKLIEYELELKVLKNRIINSQNEISDTRISILNILKDNVNLLIIDINNLELAIESRNKSIEKINIKIGEEEDKKRILIEKLKDLNIDFSEVDGKLNLELSKIEEKLQVSIDHMNEEIKSLTLNISLIDSKMDGNKDKLLLIENKMSVIKLEIEKISENPIRINYIKLISEYDLTGLKKEEIENIKSSKEVQLKEIIERITQLELSIENLDEAHIDSKIEQLKVDNRILEDILMRLNKQCSVFLRAENFVEERFLEDKSTLTKQVDELLEINNTVSYTLDILKSHLENRYLLEKQDKLNLLKEDLLKVKIKRDYIMTLKSESYTHIKDKIQMTFNEDSINEIFHLLDPLEASPKVAFELDEKSGESLGMDVFLINEHKQESNAPILYLSSAQVNILSLSIFLASAIENIETFNTILLDDPLQHLDGLNILSFIDLIRIIAFSLDIQIIISTHNKTFFDLCRKKIPSKYCNAKYIDLSPKPI